MPNKPIVIFRGRRGLTQPLTPADVTAIGASLQTAIGTEVDSLRSLTSRTIIYFDAVNGSPTGDGSTGDPVSTAARVAELMTPGWNILELRSNIDWNVTVQFRKEIYLDVHSEAGQTHSMTFVDVDGGTTMSSIRSHVGLTINFANVRLALNSPLGEASAIWAYGGGRVSVWLRSCEIDYVSGGSRADFFGTIYAGFINVHVQNVTINSNTAGHLFRNVNAGSDPNLNNNISTTIPTG